IGVGALQKRALQNLERGGEPAEKISRRHQIRQEINFRRLFVHESGRRAIIVDPPATCSPTLTSTVAARGKYTSVREPTRIIPRRTIRMDVEHRQENPDPAHFCFHNLGLFNFGNIFHHAIGGRDDRVRISWNISVWISKKEKRVEDQNPKEQRQPTAEKPTSEREKK